MFQNYGEKPVLIDEHYGTLSYQQLFDEAEQLYQQIGRRCLVFSLCKNSAESVIGYVSFLNHRVVPLLLSAGIDSSLFQTLLNLYRPQYIWCPAEWMERLAELAHQTEHGHPSGCEGASDCGYGSEWTASYRHRDYCLIKTGYEACELFDELALLLTTSGSTGSPKLVRQSYRNIASNMEAIATYLELRDTERPVTTLPMNYTYGLSVLNSHLHVGATVLLTDQTIMQKEFWKFLREQKATSIAGVPYTYEMLERLRFFRMDLPFLRTMTQAGGKLSPELHKKFAEYAAAQGKRFVVMYGQTEATARMAYLPYERSLEKYGSMGIAIPGGRFELIDMDGNVISAPDSVGELVYYGENVTLGYAESQQDLALGDERNGRLVTGDMAKRDLDGYYYIVGRKKRFLKVFGNRVNLDEMERMIRQAFPEMDCACAGRDDQLHIFLTDEGKADDVKKYASEKTGLHASAFVVQHVSAIPKNEAGKILYQALEEWM